jgi:hypothetical protein
VYHIQDFIGYARSWSEFVHHHHQARRAVISSYRRSVSIRGIIDENVEQYRAFEKVLKIFDEYLSSVTGTTFNGLKLNSIDTFTPCLMQHLRDEIFTIMGLARFGTKVDIAAINEKVAIKSLAQLSTDTVLPFFVTALDKTIAEKDFVEFPPIPPIEGMFSRNYWKFAPCSVDRVPKEKPEVTA